MINPFSGVCVVCVCMLRIRSLSPGLLPCKAKLLTLKAVTVGSDLLLEKGWEMHPNGLAQVHLIWTQKLRWNFPSKSSWNRLKSERFLQIPQPCAFYADCATMCHTWMYSVSASWTGLQPKEQHPDRFAMLPTAGKPHRWMQTSYDSLRQRDATNYKPVKNTQSFAKRQNNN